MSLSQDQIVEAISQMTVLDVAELVKKMEEKFGVSAAAPAAMMAMPVAGGADAAGGAARQRRPRQALGAPRHGALRVSHSARGAGRRERAPHPPRVIGSRCAEVPRTHRRGPARAHGLG